MTITELEARDQADRRRTREHAIEAQRWALDRARARHARTDAIERGLYRLEAEAAS